MRLFADDVLMYATLNDQDSVASFQHDLDTLQCWANEWRMSFNTAKCNIMFVGNRNKVNTQVQYSLCGDILTNVHQTKYLGVLINDNLKWEAHVGRVTGKAYAILGLLCSSLYDTPVELKLIAYKTLCRPLLEYASDVRDPYLRKDVKAIEMVQPRGPT